MVRRWLVEDTPQGAIGREAEILEKPDRVAPLSSPLAWRILQELARAPDYPNALAARLNVHEQKVYYHVRRLERAGLLEVIREESKRGASARVLAPTAEAFAIVFKGRGKPVASPLLPHAGIVARFLEEFSSDGVFNGSIVVGSPYTHGPFSTTSRDSPYAVELGFFLGRLSAAATRSARWRRSSASPNPRRTSSMATRRGKTSIGSSPAKIATPTGGSTRCRSSSDQPRVTLSYGILSSSFAFAASIAWMASMALSSGSSDRTSTPRSAASTVAGTAP